MPISYGTDKAAAVTRAHALFRWFGLGWKVNAELPGTAGLRRGQPVRPRGGRREQPSRAGTTSTPSSRPRRSTPTPGSPTWRCVQIGGDQQAPYLEWSEKTLMPAWREAFGELTGRTHTLG